MHQVGQLLRLTKGSLIQLSPYHALSPYGRTAARINKHAVRPFHAKSNHLTSSFGTAACVIICVSWP